MSDSRSERRSRNRISPRVASLSVWPVCPAIALTVVLQLAFWAGVIWVVIVVLRCTIVGDITQTIDRAVERIEAKRGP